MVASPPPCHPWSLYSKCYGKMGMKISSDPVIDSHLRRMSASVTPSLTRGGRALLAECQRTSSACGRGSCSAMCTKSFLVGDSFFCLCCCWECLLNADFCGNARIWWKYNLLTILGGCV
ncbi:hypothetical protein CEXT_720181 [Caerostris extrusa]|uniref:Uncharacterized protein n=1 Tax=Caerostris extrusa TaxID=172846 RepID=A0AAV4T4K3_CAEEX|nr:hypothetical protein CEXT_720181 [Caerostris extrusa]